LGCSINTEYSDDDINFDYNYAENLNQNNDNMIDVEEENSEDSENENNTNYKFYKNSCKIPMGTVYFNNSALDYNQTTNEVIKITENNQGKLI